MIYKNVRYKREVSPSLDILDYDKYPPSFGRLNPILTSNGISVLPSLRYAGGDATMDIWRSWGYGPTLNYNNTTPAVTIGLDIPLFDIPLFGFREKAVKFNYGSYFIAANDIVVGNIGLNDFVCEMFIKTPPQNTNYDIVYTKAAAGAPTTLIYWDFGSSRLIYQFDDSLVSVSIGTDALSLNTWYHIMFFGNRNEATINGGYAYVNGVRQTNGYDLTLLVAGDISCNGGLRIGDHLDFTKSRMEIAYVASWFYPSWHAAGAAGPTEWDVIASERFTFLKDLKPNQDRSGVVDVVFSRNSIAYTDIVEQNGARKLHCVGINFPRSSKRIDKNSKSFKGYLAESSGTNEIWYSDTMGTYWFQKEVTVGNNAIISPEKYLNAELIKETAANDLHYVWQGPAFVDNEVCCASVWAKVFDRTWAIVKCEGDVIKAYFDLSNATVGTVTGGSAYIENWGDGWRRCIVVGTSSAAAWETVAIGPALSDGVASYVGTVGSGIYAYGFQFERGIHYPSSYIKTYNASVTRLADTLRYTGSFQEDVRGRVEIEMLRDCFDFKIDKHICSLNFSGSNDNEIKLFLTGSNNTLVAYCKSGSAEQYNISGTTDISNGCVTEIKHSWDFNDAKIYVNNISEGENNLSCSLPRGLERIDLGNDSSQLNQFNGIISSFKIYKEKE